MAEESEQEPLTLDQWFESIMQLHGRPCYVLLRIEKDCKFTLQAVGSNEDNLKLMLERKDMAKSPSYMG